MERIITRIRPASALRIGAIMGLVFFLTFGALGSITQTFRVTMFAAIVDSDTYDGNLSRGSTQNFLTSIINAFGAICGVGFVGLIGIPMGALQGVVFAWVYNFAARRVGGLQVIIQERDKPLPNPPTPQAERPDNIR